MGISFKITEEGLEYLRIAQHQDSSGYHLGYAQDNSGQNMDRFGFMSGWLGLEMSMCPSVHVFI